ncbi:hypothetical protein BDQ94DRAFT_184880 [Aspergillus welwitschiae]|uniref:Zn(2)-C6 fungal-type domain-containing protein n=1 Tax=Aspergillus welwitschiae TaxID=1341132 RepID=A0A3F3QC66_9EURO|nr:hypothetical protein BDQ94DRAFT_184880 [Aspergillus welwitschiae]RDH36793.1 hypothetical protein BDQ94DRAFT_184880 [Aspergillus welwitschiae]
MAPSIRALLASQTNEHSHKLLIPRAQARVRTLNARSRTSQACDGCRKRKAKCNGTKPTCSHCEGLAIECTYSEQRRSRERKELDELRCIIKGHEYMIRSIISRSFNSLPSTVAEPSGWLAQQNFAQVPRASRTVTQQNGLEGLGNALQVLQDRLYELHRIYEAIHDCDLEKLPSVINTIRHSISAHDAATRLVRQVPEQRPVISLENMQQVWITQLSGQAQMVERQPPYSVNAIGLWSDQVDNTTASHLFSLFFVWENPTWRLIEPSLFLNHFHRGETGFCSSLLVHVILFYACHFSYNLAKPWDRRRETEVAKLLLTVVEKYWRRDKNRICLPTMQSSLLLGLFFCAMGRDKIGVRYIQYGALMALQLGLHTSSAETFRAHCETDAESNLRAHKITACAVYDIELISAQVSGRPSVWSQPPEIFIDEGEARDGDLNEQWTPYPFTTPLYRPYTNTSTWARRTFLIIVNDVVQLSSQSGIPTDPHRWERAAILYQRLDTFKKTLPAVLEVEKNRLPHNICLHLYYYTTVVNLCGMFRAGPHSLIESGSTRSINFNPNKILEEAMESMGTLILLYRACHGWKSIPVVMMHYFLVVGVHAASRLECEKWREILVSCVAGLWHMSLVWRLCRAFLRTFELVLSSVAPELVPEEVRSILDEHHAKFWTRGELESLAANYVVHHYPKRQLEEGNSGSGCFHGERLEHVIRGFG